MKSQESRRSAKLGKLYEALLLALYERRNPNRARVIANRLHRSLSSFSTQPESIFVEECRSLIAETQSDLPNAIRHRKNEIELIRRLHEISRNTASQDFVFGQYDYTDLRDRLTLLAMLYHDAGDIHEAIATLEESKRLCADHTMKFEDDDLIREYSRVLPSTTYYLTASENGRLRIEETTRDSSPATPSSITETIEKLVMPVIGVSQQVPAGSTIEAAASDAPDQQQLMTERGGADANTKTVDWSIRLPDAPDSFSLAFAGNRA
jgi:hypothetical protein